MSTGFIKLPQVLKYFYEVEIKLSNGLPILRWISYAFGNHFDENMHTGQFGFMQKHTLKKILVSASFSLEILDISYDRIYRWTESGYKVNTNRSNFHCYAFQIRLKCILFKEIEICFSYPFKHGAFLRSGFS